MEIKISWRKISWCKEAILDLKRIYCCHHFKVFISWSLNIIYDQIVTNFFVQQAQTTVNITISHGVNITVQAMNCHGHYGDVDRIVVTPVQCHLNRKDSSCTCRKERWFSVWRSPQKGKRENWSCVRDKRREQLLHFPREDTVCHCKH